MVRDGVAAEDLGNIVMLEHVNITVPDQTLATVFYVQGLGLTRDPYMMVGPENTWVNVGDQQFHLPTRAPQVVPGEIGLVVPDFAGLPRRLERVAPRLEGTQFAWAQDGDAVLVTGPWGNRFRCHPPAGNGGMRLGMPYVELRVAPGAAAGIARFYTQVLRAPSILEETPQGGVATVQVGVDQSLVFRETAGETRPYDGHHIAIYVADFSGPYEHLRARGLVTEEPAFHQFRFVDLVDPEGGQRLFQLEHEVRSMRHPMYRRPLVNRNPAQSLRGYVRGGDATPF